MPSLTYFVVMQDYPKQRARESIVNPEHTRADVVALICSGEWENVLFVHEVTVGEVTRDITADIAQEIHEGLAGEPCPEFLVDFVEANISGFVRRAA